MSEESPGTRIGPYVVVHRLERQAGEVYLARGVNDKLRARFLLVLFEVREVDAQIIEAEVARCMRVDHRGITRPIEMLEHGDKRVLVFEGVPGTSLERLVEQLWAEGERLPLPVVYHIANSIFSALDAVHTLEDDDGKSSPVVHGQLGLHQVMISWSGAITILGFGMSRLYHLAEEEAGEPEDLAPFMAPEQRAGYAPTPRGNVYSAAAIVWALLANERPPADESKPQSLLERREGLPPKIAECIDLALEPVLTKRDVTCGDIAQVFASRAGGEGQRDLRWIIDIFRGLGEGGLDLSSAESSQQAPTTASSEPRVAPPVAEPPTTARADADDPLADVWEGLDDGGSYAFMGDRRNLDGRLAPPKAVSAVTSAESGYERRHTDPGMLAPAGAKPRRSDKTADSGAAGLAPTRLAAARMPSVRKGGATSEPQQQADLLFPGVDSNKPPRPTDPADQPPPEEQAGSTTPKHLPRVAPLPQRLPEDLKTLGDELASEQGMPTPPDLSRGIAPPQVEDEPAGLDEDDDGIYVTPSVRPGALAEAPFLTPASFSPAIGGPPFVTPQDYDPAPSSSGEIGARIAPSDPGRPAKTTGSSLSLKWSAFLVVAVLFAFVAGMIVAGGPIRLGPFETPSATTADMAQVPSAADLATGSRPTTTIAGSQPSPTGTDSAAAALLEPGTDDPGIPADLDGTQLPASRGYLIVWCPDRPDLRVYVSGKIVRVGEPVRVPCGLTNVRLGTYPLGTWFGPGRSIPVACRSVTTVTMPVGKPISPGRERGGASTGVSPGPSKPTSSTTPSEPDDTYED